ncbi:MAG: hypothetical protein ACOYMG_25875, partial [Candidatus Methylumidiphilus sp.]
LFGRNCMRNLTSIWGIPQLEKPVFASLHRAVANGSDLGAKCAQEGTGQSVDPGIGAGALLAAVAGLDEGKYRSLTEIAAVEGIDLGQASRTAQLARLAPGIVESCLSDGRAGPKLEQLGRVCLAGSWVDQCATLKSSHGRQSV